MKPKTFVEHWLRDKDCNYIREFQTAISVGYYELIRMYKEEKNCNITPSEYKVLKDFENMKDIADNIFLQPLYEQCPEVYGDLVLQLAEQKKDIPCFNITTKKQSF